MPEKEDYENELRVAATEGDVDSVLEMIAEGVDIEAGNEVNNYQIMTDCNDKH